MPNHFESPLDALKLTISNDILLLVIRYTNQKHERYCHDHFCNFAVRRFKGYKPFNKEEVLAFRGLSFIARALKCNQQRIFDLYNSKFLPHFKAAMSRDRLLLLIKFCHLDDADTKNDQRDDRFGHIREAWELFNNRCRELYGLGPHVTIDEMLQKFCECCRFRQYMPQKAGRYGIKYWILADAESHYCFNAIPSLGKEGDTPAVNLGVTVVTKLVEPIPNSHKNVTCDRFFTSVDLFEDLHKDNLSAVGNVKANRKNLPVKLLPSQAKERTVGDSIFAFKENTTMVSWYPKRAKVILLLSTMHHDGKIGDSGKLEIVEFYTKTKAGVDELDQKVRHYTKYRKTSRWLLAVFYDILDLLAYNAFVLYKLRPPVVTGINMTSRARFRFLCARGKQLIKSNMLNIAQYPNGLNPTVRALEALSVGIGPQKQAWALDGPPQKKRCMVCPRSSDQKVRQQCKECKRNVLKKHSKTILLCNDCFTA